MDGLQRVVGRVKRLGRTESGGGLEEKRGSPKVVNSSSKSQSGRSKLSLLWRMAGGGIMQVQVPSQGLLRAKRATLSPPNSTTSTLRLAGRLSVLPPHRSLSTQIRQA